VGSSPHLVLDGAALVARILDAGGDRGLHPRRPARAGPDPRRQHCRATVRATGGRRLRSRSWRTGGPVHRRRGIGSGRRREREAGRAPVPTGQIRPRHRGSEGRHRPQRRDVGPRGSHRPVRRRLVPGGGDGRGAGDVLGDGQRRRREARCGRGGHRDTDRGDHRFGRSDETGAGRSGRRLRRDVGVQGGAERPLRPRRAGFVRWVDGRRSPRRSPRRGLWDPGDREDRPVHGGRERRAVRALPLRACRPWPTTWGPSPGERAGTMSSTGSSVTATPSTGAGPAVTPTEWSGWCGAR
jgi:hypothetical protein